jgi:hypothetical protein
MREYGFDELDLAPPRPKNGRSADPQSDATDVPTSAREGRAFLRDLTIIAAGFLGIVVLIRALVAALAG